MTQIVKRAESLGAQVARVLRQRIVRGDLAPGTRITEEALAEEFDVSRGPIRDALTQLSFENLVEVQRPRGVYITGLTKDDVDHSTACAAPSSSSPSLGRCASTTQRAGRRWRRPSGA